MGVPTPQCLKTQPSTRKKERGARSQIGGLWPLSLAASRAKTFFFGTKNKTKNLSQERKKK